MRNVAARVSQADAPPSLGRRRVLAGAALLLAGAGTPLAWAQTKGWQTEPVRQQAKALRERHEERWKLLEDEALLPGGCRIETLHSRIDATMETRIEKAVAQLFDQLHDQALHPATPDLSIELDARDAP